MSLRVFPAPERVECVTKPLASPILKDKNLILIYISLIPPYLQGRPRKVGRD